MVSQHYLSFPFYLPRILAILKNWPLYLHNYLLRKRNPAEYVLRNGFRLRDAMGTLAGTIAVVFIRREYGDVSDFKSIIDVGANIGAFAFYAAEMSPKSKIYCYEPETRNFALLSKNIRANNLSDRVTLFNCAVAGATESRKMAVGESPLNSLINADRAVNEQKVQCITLRKVLEDCELSSVDLLKLNCEGAEYEILASCSTADFLKFPNIRLEYHNFDNVRNGAAVVKVLREAGYHILRFTNYQNVSGFIWATRIGAGLNGN
jgi:FkbM family methyltransferase